MAHLIDKDALVAEVERIQRYCPEHGNCLDGILDFINTLEVKEVDLKNSVKGRIDYPLISIDFSNIYPNYKELKDYCDKNGIKDEDEVKIIIIKE